MGMTSSTPQPDSEDVLVHSFQLDADASCCSVSLLCPRKQAMFPVPANLPDHIEHLIPLKDVTNILNDLNDIIKNTGFELSFSNPVYVLTIVFMLFMSILTMPFLLSGGGKGYGAGTLAIIQQYLLIVLPLIILLYVVNFIIFFYCRSRRKNAILGYLEEWNRNDRGVKLNIGGYRSGVTFGSEQGGNYYHFRAATFDSKSLKTRGYLHVVVNKRQREAWCRNNGVQYVVPYTAEQQNLASVLGSQVPPGFMMVPQQQFQVPPGYVLVPQNEVAPLPRTTSSPI